MGKKSLFEPTDGSAKAKKSSASKKAFASKKASAAKKAAPAPKKKPNRKSAVEMVVASKPEPIINTAEETAILAPSPEPASSMAEETAAPAPDHTIISEAAAAPAEPATGTAEEAVITASENISAGETAPVPEAPPEPATPPVEEPLKAETAAVASDQADTTAKPIGLSEANPVITPPADEEQPFEPDPPPLESDVSSFEKDPLISKSALTFGLAVACGLILILMIASSINSGKYYMKEIRGAVKIWKGNFSPAGRDPVMVLQGAHWGRPLRDSYPREDVYSFAALYYLKKVMPLAETSVSENFDRIAYLLDRARKLVPRKKYPEAGAVIRKAGKDISEARILQSSGEEAAVSLAREKLDAAGRALTALMTDLGAAGQEAAAESGH